MSENREKIKQEHINKLGALDFHFQVPNFDNPLMLISSIIVEVSKFASAMQEFNKEKIIKPDTQIEAAMKAAAKAEIWNMWNMWNIMIGMVLTSNDPATLLAFNDTMKDFTKQLIINPLKEEGN